MHFQVGNSKTKLCHPHIRRVLKYCPSLSTKNEFNPDAFTGGRSFKNENV